MIDINDVEAAAKRIARAIRRTPLLGADHCADPATDAELWLKLECLQPTGSFKARGAANKLLTTPREMQVETTLVAIGGG
jgi:threonine dehydratase